MKPEETIDFLKGIQNENADYSMEEAISVLKETHHYRLIKDATIGEIAEALKEYAEIGTVEECREAMEKLKRAEEALNVILSGNYNDECNFCVHHDNPMANCQCISGDGSWCFYNAKWNGRVSDNDNLEGMEE